MHLARASHLARGWSCMPGSSSGAAFANTRSFTPAWVQVSPDPPPRLGSPASQHIVSSLDSWFVCVAAD